MAARNPEGAAYPLKSPGELWDLCLSCARYIHRGEREEASTDLTQRAARLLFGTAAVETGFRTRRQYGFSLETTRGAWGLWQLEVISVRESQRRLGRDPLLARRAGRWIWDGDCPAGWYLRYRAEDLVRAMAVPMHDKFGTVLDPDRMSCAFARLHYLWDAHAIPAGVPMQAEYWKRVYNTAAGKGQPSVYVARWRSLCEAVAKD